MFMQYKKCNEYIHDMICQNTQDNTLIIYKVVYE